MKITLDTARIDDEDVLGAVLTHFLATDGGHPYHGRAEHVPGWTDLTGTTSRPLLVAIMGDGIYEDPRPVVSHIRHDETGLEALWYADGKLVVMFHQPGEGGFTIYNSHNGFGSNWTRQDLQDARNDPAHDPWAVPLDA